MRLYPIDAEPDIDLAEPLFSELAECTADQGGGVTRSSVFAGMGIPTGMLFIRNENESHNAGEQMSIPDFARAAAVLACLCWAPPTLIDRSVGS